MRCGTPDICSDTREDPLPEYKSDQCGIQAGHDYQFISVSGALKQFSDQDIIGKLCEWVNQRAPAFFAEHPEKNGRSKLAEVEECASRSNVFLYSPSDYHGASEAASDKTVLGE